MHLSSGELVVGGDQSRVHVGGAGGYAQGTGKLCYSSTRLCVAAFCVYSLQHDVLVYELA
ncbi:hypothetical protein Spla01_02441 [Streptomyces platensis]|uniref:Uncharacterized protein n=1 Tax=Streptomyces platensis TaxID=58346 RepID=A0ABX3XSR7_STRPT|nr:hypothetical protein BG653_05052 [Streptomyces platensis]BCK73699.1 hypothetical protein Srufu_076520 [Streptomyces libani subsp. rufus]